MHVLGFSRVYIKQNKNLQGLRSVSLLGTYLCQRRARSLLFLSSFNLNVSGQQDGELFKPESIWVTGSWPKLFTTTSTRPSLSCDHPQREDDSPKWDQYYIINAISVFHQAGPSHTLAPHLCSPFTPRWHQTCFAFAIPFYIWSPIEPVYFDLDLRPLPTTSACLCQTPDVCALTQLFQNKHQLVEQVQIHPSGRLLVQTNRI